MHATSQPERLGQFEISETLSSDASGSVYLAFDPSSQREVTLRTVSKAFLEGYGPGAVGRFRSEAQAAALLRHPGILSVWGGGEDSDLVFIALEYEEGRTLKEVVDLPLNDAVSLAVQLLGAVDYAHEQGVVHRDLRPANLLINAQGKLRVNGFGVTRFDSATSLYLSPEQFMGLPADRRSDIFSAGVLFYEFLTGVNPFSGLQQKLADRVCNVRERPMSECKVGLPPLFDPVCSKALAKGVFDRYPTARAFSERIEKAFEAIYGFTVPGSVSKETLELRLVRSSRNSGTLNRTAASPRLPAEETDATWSNEALHEVEIQLAKFIGPLARIVVKESAAKTSDKERLYELAAASLSSEADRKAFLTGRTGGGSEAVAVKSGDAPVPKSQPTASDTVPPTPPPSQALAKPSPIPVSKPEIRLQTPRANALPPEPGPNPAPKPQVSAPQLPAAAEIPRPGGGSAWEELLGKQPDSLAGYLQDEPAQVEEVIQAFTESAKAVLALSTGGNKNMALIPQNIRLDRLGHATIDALPQVATQGTSSAAGKPRYAVPESFAEKAKVDEAAIAIGHIYALGVIFYEILLGKKLFDKTFAGQRSDLDWLRWHADLEAKAPAIKSVLPGFPSSLSDLIESMMQKRVDKRMSDLSVVVSRLREVAQRANHTVVLGPKVASVKVPAQIKAESAQPGKNHTGLLIGVLFLLVVLVAAGFLIWQYPDLVRGWLARFSGS